MNVSLNIGLDLGNNTLKIAFAYETKDHVVFGKIVGGGFSRQTEVAIPAVAFYDAEKGEWLFGGDVGNSASSSFINVVKIKNLLSLLERVDSESVLKSNIRYYREKNEFPKFYFPVRRKMLDDFDSMVRGGQTFSVAGYTPKRICEEFFAHAAKITSERVNELLTARGLGLKSIKLAVVYPPKVGNDYVDELVRIVSQAFGEKVDKVLSSTKALGMLAYQRELFSEKESALVFDMGDENISVARIGITGGNVCIDGADGHSLPIAVGGQDVDELIAGYLADKTLSKSETVGTPSHGEEGHIEESVLHSKQYLFMNEIKKAKIALSNDALMNEHFKNGVPIGINRDVYVQVRFKRSEFSGCIGIDDDSKLAKCAADYVLNELALAVNKGVKKVFLSGGLSETYKLFDYVADRVHTIFPKVDVSGFNIESDTDDGFNILAHEDAVYSPAVGGALVALKNCDVGTVLALSYGTWGADALTNIKKLCIFVNRGTPLTGPKGKPLKGKETQSFSTRFLLSFEIAGDEILACSLTEKDIKESFNGRLLVYDQGSKERARLEKAIGMRTVSGGADAKIKLSYNGRPIKRVQNGVYFEEGITVDASGHAVPWSENSPKNEGSAQVEYRDGGTEYVPKRNIDIRIEGMDAFQADAGE